METDIDRSESTSQRSDIGGPVVNIAAFHDITPYYGESTYKVNMKLLQEPDPLFFSIGGVTEEVGGEPGLSQHP